MNVIKHQMFKKIEHHEMMAWLNNKYVSDNIISITQAKNNDFNIFYEGKNLARMLADVQDVNDSCKSNPDKSGGSFTDQEINENGWK